jgi:hypothetical protein
MPVDEREDQPQNEVEADAARALEQALERSGADVT